MTRDRSHSFARLEEPLTVKRLCVSYGRAEEFIPFDHVQLPPNLSPVIESPLSSGDAGTYRANGSRFNIFIVRALIDRPNGGSFITS